MKISLILISPFLIFISLQCQANQNFRSLEDSLKKLSLRIIEPINDFERLTINHEFKSLLSEVLHMPGSFDYPFDSLKTVSRLKSPDGSFRIFSWYVPLQNSRFEYFGFFQYYDSRRKTSEIFLLVDRAHEVDEFMFQTLDHEHWYGAYYLDLIHKRHRRKDYFLLLGWRGDNPLTRKRIIEPVKIMGGGRPVFGQPIFRYENNRYRRIIFEYSARVSMAMRYENQQPEPGKRATNVIIFDRMAPTQGYLKGNYQFYVPETNVFDAFVFEDGNWVFTPDIDARNPRRTPPPRPVPQR